MIQTVFTAALPVGERLVIQKNHIVGTLQSGPRVAIVTGVSGDELEGQFVAFELARRLNERLSSLAGTVDIYPALNPLGLSAHIHGMPSFDIDLDHTFPGNPQGSLNEVLSDAVFNDILGAHACIIVRSSSSLMQEVTQIRIDEHKSDVLLELARHLNVRLIWVRTPTPELGSTLAHTLNGQGTPTIVIETGLGMRVSEDDGMWLVEGILRLLEHLGSWKGSMFMFPDPKISNGENVLSAVANAPGLFLPCVSHDSEVRYGQVIGKVVNSLEGTIKQEVHSPCDGLLFSLRTYPIVHPGSLLARILEERS